jgi:hypothetical protein
MPRATASRFAPAAAALAALVAAGAASAAFVVPPSTIAQDKLVLSQMAGPGGGDFFRIPTWAPRRYVESSSGLGTTYVDLVLTDNRYVRKTGKTMLKHSLAFTSEVVPLTLARCRTKKPEQPGPVPPTGRSAWICVTGRKGAVVRLSAYGPGLSLRTLRHVVTSAKPA